MIGFKIGRSSSLSSDLLRGTRSRRYVLKVIMWARLGGEGRVREEGRRSATQFMPFEGSATALLNNRKTDGQRLNPNVKRLLRLWEC